MLGKLHRDFQFTHYWTQLFQMDLCGKQMKMAVGISQANSSPKGTSCVTGTLCSQENGTSSPFGVQVVCVIFTWKKKPVRNHIKFGCSGYLIFCWRCQEPLHVPREVSQHVSSLTKISLQKNKWFVKHFMLIFWLLQPLVFSLWTRHTWETQMQEIV